MHSFIFLVSLAPLLPSQLLLGMEIRQKVTQYVEQRIDALREESPGSFDHISVMRMNAMVRF